MSYNQSSDPYGQVSSPVASQARSAFAITPSDTVDLPVYAKALYIGAVGDVTVIPITEVGDVPITFKNHPVGYMPVQVRRVMATNTVATNIVGLGA